jgi:hypothetical protein
VNVFVDGVVKLVFIQFKAPGCGEQLLYGTQTTSYLAGGAVKRQKEKPSRWMVFVFVF